MVDRHGARHLTSASPLGGLGGDRETQRWSSHTGGERQSNSAKPPRATIATRASAAATTAHQRASPFVSKLSAAGFWRPSGAQGQAHVRINTSLRPVPEVSLKPQTLNRETLNNRNVILK